MSPFLFMLGLFLNIFSIMLCTFSNSWIILWFLLELNTISFIILLIKRNNYNFDASIIKYFLFQAMTSIFLFLSFTHKNLSEFMSSMFIFMKLGIFPYHMWFMSLVSDLDPMNFILLSTTQKVVPFRMFQFLEMSYLMYLFMVLSLIGGALYCSLQIKLIMMMGASGVYSTSWIALFFKTLLSGSWLYLMSYFILTIIFVWSLESLKVMNKLNTNMNFYSITLILMILMLSAFPPSPLFFFKIFLVVSILKNYTFLLGFIILLFDPLVIYMYINMFLILTLKD